MDFFKVMFLSFFSFLPFLSFPFLSFPFLSFSLSFYLSFFQHDYWFEREKKGGREKHWWVASYMWPNKGLNPQPRHVTDWEYNRWLFSLWGDAPTSWVMLARAVTEFLLYSAFPHSLVLLIPSSPFWFLFPISITNITLLLPLCLAHPGPQQCNINRNVQGSAFEYKIPMRHVIWPWIIQKTSSFSTLISVTDEKVKPRLNLFKRRERKKVNKNIMK